MPTLDGFTRAYIEAALWSSGVDDGDALDANYSMEDIAPETLATMIADCERFQVECDAELIASNMTPECNARYATHEIAGHDFWLTRCGHGSGFWDGDWIEPAATKLTDSAHAFGNVDLYIGDDGMVYA
jgi:hypothetical protein